jgi:hypothetical protein
MVDGGEPSQDWVSTIESGTAAAIANFSAASSALSQGAPPGASPPLPFDVYTGTYANDFYGEVTVGEEDDGLILKLGPNPNRHPLRHWDRDTFSYRLAGSGSAYLEQLGAVFTIGAEGYADAVTVGLGVIGPDIEEATFTRAADR